MSVLEGFSKEISQRHHILNVMHTYLDEKIIIIIKHI